MSSNRLCNSLRKGLIRPVISALLIWATVPGLLMPAVSLAAGGNDGFIVVVHPDNKTDSMGKKELSKIFLKKNRYWENGDQVIPADLLPPSETRERFSRAVHGKSVKGIYQYWRLRVFGFSETPPTEFASEEQVLQLVANNPAAIGYVSAGADLTQYRVKKLRITD